MYLPITERIIRQTWLIKSLQEHATIHMCIWTKLRNKEEALVVVKKKSSKVLSSTPNRTRSNAKIKSRSKADGKLFVQKGHVCKSYSLLYRDALGYFVFQMILFIAFLSLYWGAGELGRTCRGQGKQRLMVQNHARVPCDTNESYCPRFKHSRMSNLKVIVRTKFKLIARGILFIYL